VGQVVFVTRSCAELCYSVTGID